MDILRESNRMIPSKSHLTNVHLFLLILVALIDSFQKNLQIFQTNATDHMHISRKLLLEFICLPFELFIEHLCNFQI